MCLQTEVQETNEQLQETLSFINNGNIVLGDGTVTATVFQKPETDVEAIWQIKKKTEKGVS